MACIEPLVHRRARFPPQLASAPATSDATLKRALLAAGRKRLALTTSENSPREHPIASPE
jgi:hypothetical protein